MPDHDLQQHQRCVASITVLCSLSDISARRALYADFCLWSSPQPNQPIADSEAIEVAYCTDKKYGARLIPDGTLQGVQFLVAPDYIEMIAFIDQTKINLPGDDFGGELDPHGADLVRVMFCLLRFVYDLHVVASLQRGNPMGGLVYSTAFDPAGQTDLEQVSDWNEFIGGGQMCIKLCNPNSPNRAALCENRYDRVGLMYNCPNQAQNGTFEICDSEDQDPVGIYTTNGVTMTYTQPPESLGAITTQPYNVRIPSSSNCKTFQSTDLYTALLAVQTPGSTASGSAANPTGAPSGTGKGASGSNPSRTSSGGAAPTGANQDNNAGAATRVSVFATVFGVVAAVAFLS